MSSKPYAIEAGKGADYLQAVRSDHNNQLGTSGAALTVPAAAVVNSDPAPTGGMVVVSLPSGTVAGLRFGAGVVATADDQHYYGPNVWHFPIEAGQRVSLFGVTGGPFTATVSMAQNRGANS